MVAMRDSSGAALAARRFAGWEPLGFEAGDNNWYRFVANGPTARTDPTGLIPLDTIWDIANIVYDIAVGDHVSLAADVAALAIPYVPAGSTKLVKAAKLADAKRGSGIQFSPRAPPQASTKPRLMPFFIIDFPLINNDYSCSQS